MEAGRKIVVLAGDGIGPEIVDATRQVLDLLGEFSWEEHLIGGASIDEHGTALTDEVVGSARAAFRMERVTVMAASFGRHDLTERLQEATRDVTDGLERVIALAQRVGFVRADLDSRAVALAVQAYAIGLVIADLDPARPDDDRLAEVIEAFLDGVFVPA
jgi:hypothetical protein